MAHGASAVSVLWPVCVAQCVRGWAYSVCGGVCPLPMMEVPCTKFYSNPSSFHHPHSTILIPPSSFHHPHSTFLIPPSLFLLPHSTFLIPPSSFHLPHSTFFISPTSCHPPHSAFLIQHTTFFTLRFTLPRGPPCCFAGLHPI